MSTHHGSNNENNGHGGGGSAHHIVPFKVYFIVWGALLVGTVLTVAVAQVDFGSWNMVIAMLVATVKASLVMMFFMGLKYDTAENSVAFLMSFVFLGIFISLTAADVFTRPHLEAAAVSKEALTGSGEVNIRKLSQYSPEALARGKELFKQTCAVCHGVEGKGDGPGGVALDPKPRNFTVSVGWKNGRTIVGIYKTLEEGIKDTGMASYAGLPPEDRFALAHYVQSLGSEVIADPIGDLTALSASLKPKKPELSADKAMARFAAGRGGDQAPTTYNYVQGKGYVRGGEQPNPQTNAPKSEYCKLPLQYRPDWCNVNTTEPQPL